MNTVMKGTKLIIFVMPLRSGIPSGRFRGLGGRGGGGLGSGRREQLSRGLGDRADEGHDHEADDNVSDRDCAAANLAGEARIKRDPEERLREELVGVAVDLWEDEQAVDGHEHGHLREHRQAPGKRRGLLARIELHRLALQHLWVLVLALQLGELRRDALARERRLHL